FLCFGFVVFVPGHPNTQTVSRFFPKPCAALQKKWRSPRPRARIVEAPRLFPEQLWADHYRMITCNCSRLWAPKNFVPEAFRIADRRAASPIGDPSANRYAQAATLRRVAQAAGRQSHDRQEQ